MALEIDGYAHDGVVQVGGETAAVLGCGLNSIYPDRHQKLAKKLYCRVPWCLSSTPTQSQK